MRTLSMFLVLVAFGFECVVSLASGDKPAQAKESRDKPNLPDGVVHIALPPGEIRMEHVIGNNKPLVRVSVDKVMIESRILFLGDTEGATRFDAANDGIHWTPASGGKDFVFGLGNVSVRKPES